ncbi:MAG: LTA synthase family protein [Tessaracoccus sp.]|uniref:LTA synthase family protein n=1 Tax=Tessaracoccus sp. TaxID=1971211 RepID=UPI001EC162DB|nr:LTA synthase family protein [Tessaracoccus sp.]MBK7820712.1 LTA synthase family protein [Tessaracoccus sp.]
MWGRLVVLLVPVTILGVWLKAIRIRIFYPGSGPLDIAVKIASDVAFGGAWLLLWLVACHLARGRARTVVFCLAHLATLIVALVFVTNHEYMIRTGNPVTWDYFVTFARELAELGPMIGSQMTADSYVLIAVAVGSVVVLPLLLGWAVERPLREPSALVRRLAVVGAVGLLAASVWSAPTVSAAFALAPPVQIAMGEVREALAYPEALADDIDPQPAQTRLAPRGEWQKNVVVITLESHRATSTLPETRYPVTPVLDALAETSITPERGYSVLPHTSKALTAVYCGIAPPLDQLNTEADPGSLPARCLPELLAEQGYATGFFQTATERFERRRGTVANLGFDDFMAVDTMSRAGYNRANYFGYEDDIMLPPQRAWLERHRDQPFLLGMLTVTGHHDYALEGYETIDFVDDPLLNSYLNSIHYQDRFVGHVIEIFKELGLYEDTVFVITGDHGEGFGEHRVYQHDNTIYEEGLRIPYLVHDPSHAGKLVPGPVSQLAVLPTVVDAAGFDLRSVDEYYPSLLSDEPQPPALATCYARGRCAATMEGDMKVIHHFGDRRDEVYNLVDDPYELNDLAAETDGAWIREQVDKTLAWYLNSEQRYQAFRGEG